MWRPARWCARSTLERVLMVSGRWTIPPVKPIRAVASTLLAAGLAIACLPPASAAAPCKPIYLTLDTGHMAVAPLMAEILNKHQVKVTFFAANERTQTGDGSLGAEWAPWWKARAAEGHEFASHTWDHVYWRGDIAAAAGAQPQFRMRPSAGALEGKD